MALLKDRTGQRHGRLLVISRSANRGSHTHWLCRCDCGNECEVSAFRLDSQSSEPTRSCGCLRKSPKEWRRLSSKRARWLLDNPDKAKKFHRHFNLKSKYGLTEEQYDAMFIAQCGLCAICERPLPKFEERGGHPPVDHDHKTGKNRGIVHGTCNKALGLLNDDPALLRKAAAYLESHV